MHNLAAIIFSMFVFLNESTDYEFCIQFICLFWRFVLPVFCRFGPVFRRRTVALPGDNASKRYDPVALLKRQKKQRPTSVNCCFLLSCRTFGRQVGFEPTTHGTTIRYSNQLSYNRHIGCLKKTRQKYTFFQFLHHIMKEFFPYLISGSFSWLRWRGRDPG